MFFLAASTQPGKDAVQRRALERLAAQNSVSVNLAGRRSQLSRSHAGDVLRMVGVPATSRDKVRGTTHTMTRVDATSLPKSSRETRLQKIMARQQSGARTWLPQTT